MYQTWCEIHNDLELRDVYRIENLCNPRSPWFEGCEKFVANENLSKEDMWIDMVRKNEIVICGNIKKLS